MGNIFLTQYSGAFLGPIAKVLGAILNVLYNFLSIFNIENIGLTIILFTFLVNGLMIPLTIKQQKYSRLSSKMSPEMQKITQKYKNKKDEASMRAQQAELQALYNKYGTSPTGGCLPMLITFPIMFALYQVIYHIPAYVDSIKLVYEQAAMAIQNTGNYVDLLTTYIAGQPNAISTAVTVSTSKWGELSGALAASNPHSLDYIIDILTQFKTPHWDLLAQSFPTISSTVQSVAGQVDHMNNFLGLNIANNPAIASLSVLVPILAVASQILQTKLMTATTAKGDDSASTMASTMKTMNIVMPFFSGFICFMMPIGVGIYWVAGSVFRIIQQFFVNKHMDSINIDELIEKNKEKAKKKNERKGIDPEALERAAKQHTKTIQDKSAALTKAARKTDYNSANKTQISYEPGSISSIAHMLENSNKDKKAKNKGD